MYDFTMSLKYIAWVNSIIVLVSDTELGNGNQISGE